MDIAVYGLVIIPVVIFLIGGLVAIVRGIIKFTQSLVRSEAFQKSTAESCNSIVDRLDKYIEKNDEAMGSIREDVAILKFAIRGGNHKRTQSADE